MTRVRKIYCRNEPRLMLTVETKYFFQILWKSRCYILFTFNSHLKKLRSILKKITLYTEIVTIK